VFAVKKRTIIVSFWWDRSVLTAARPAGATAVCKAVSASLTFFLPELKVKLSKGLLVISGKKYLFPSGRGLWRRNCRKALREKR